MPATQTAATVTEWGQQRTNPKSAQTMVGWAAETNPQSLDILQILDEGGKTVIKVSNLGVVTKNPSTETTQCLFGRYYTRLKSTATIAQIFADVFSQNNARQDVMQLRGQGENRIWHLDYLGVAFSS